MYVRSEHAQAGVKMGWVLLAKEMGFVNPREVDSMYNGGGGA